MKRILTAFIFGIILLSTVSAEIIMTEQPDALYNLGDTIEFPIKLTSATEISELFTIELICNGIETEVYKEYVFLTSGQEKKRTPSIPLIQSFIGKSTGTCVIKAALGSENEITDGFEISDKIYLNLSMEKTEFAPEEEVSIEFDAVKENNKPVNGIIEIISTDSSEIDAIDSISNGYAYVTFTLPSNTPAGNYILKINASEIDSQGDVTNKGSAEQTITISQVPTNLETIIENNAVEPGTNLNVQNILHDQTGEPIESTVSIILKNSDGLIVNTAEKSTSENYQYAIAYNEAPSEWTISTEAEEFETENTFEITELKKVRAEILNSTVILTNIGNVYYNDTYLIKIGDESVYLNLTLDVDESKNYLLSAPDGTYPVEVIDSTGESQLYTEVALTGSSIRLKEASNYTGTLLKHPFVWVFIVGIMGFGVFMFFKKGWKKTFFGYIPKLKKKQPQVIKKQSAPLFDASEQAELSLSIKGNPQTSSVICLKIKNFKNVRENKKGVEETLGKLSALAKENKAAIYENQDNIFILLVPALTRTFNNEKTALALSQKITNILKDHNRLFKQKIEFGISINSGTIIANKEKEKLKFMSMGTLVTTAKKIASLSDEEIFLGEKFKDKVAANVKTQKAHENNLDFYKIKEIKNTEQHKKFIRSFLDRLERKS